MNSNPDPKNNKIVLSSLGQRKENDLKVDLDDLSLDSQFSSLNSSSNLLRLANIIYNELQKHEEIAHSVIDDACYERTEATIACMIHQYGVPEELTGRVFLMNPNFGNLLSQKKPISEELNVWFEKAEKDGKLHPGAVCFSQGLTFQVDNFGALRCSDIPSIYFDRNPVAYWGIGHVAPTIGDYVIEPAMGKGPLSIDDWTAELHLPGVIPLRSTARGIPNISLDRLEEDAHPLLTNKDLSKVQKLKNKLIDSIFAEQIISGGMHPRIKWSQLFPGPLTFRGETFRKISDAEKDKCCFC